jgi:cytochrome oxidase Cu insertion factor (SCO1/SenC/PrrC family)
VRVAVLVAALAAALGFAVAAFSLRGDEAPDFRGSEPPAEQTLPDFELRDDSGRLVDAAELRGKALAVTFLDVRCTESCPVIAAQVGQALRRMGDRRGEVEALAITVDPVHDTRERIDAFLRRYRAKGQLRYLDGTPDELRPVWREFAVLDVERSGSPNMHSAPVRIYDREGRWRSTLHAGVDLTPANLAHDIALALDV